MRSEFTLADACEVIVDCPHKTAPESAQAYAYAVGTKAVSNGRINFERARPVSEETYLSWIARATPLEGDLILCREAPVGPVARVPAQPRVCLGQRTVLLRANEDIVDSRYLMYALLAPSTQDALRVQSEGSTVAHLNVADVRRFKVSLPPLAEQRRVLSVLGALDDKIDSNRRLATTLAQVVAAQFDARFVNFRGREDVRDTPDGPVPDGWRTGALAELAAQHRSHLKGPSDLPYIGLDLMPRGSTILTEWLTAGAPTGQAATFEAGDILFGKLRPYFRKVGVAPIRGRCSTEILVLRPTDPAYYGIVLGHVASQRFIDRCMAVSRGTRMPRAEWVDASSFVVAIPPADEAAAFTELTRQTYAQIQALTFEQRTLRELWRRLLPALISGRLIINGPDAEALAEPPAEELIAS